MKPEEVKDLLIKDKNGIFYPTIENFLTILNNDDKFSQIRYNTMIEQPEEDSKQWTDNSDAEMRFHIEKNYNLFSKGKLNDAFLVYLNSKAFSPVQEAIKAIRWDGQERCEEFFIKWARADNNKYSRECGRLFFAQGISRAFIPGSKCDHVITLIGKQGGGKTTLSNWLALDDKFYAKLKSIKGVEAEKNLQGAWIIELEELLATTNAETAEEVKQFISSQVDKFRDSYGHRSVNHQRTCIFIGTTNRETFLSDPTGNRRWYPLKIKQDAKFLYDHEQECKADIKQCWAEMYHYWNTNDKKHSTAPRTDDKKLMKMVLEHQQSAETDDPETGMIEQFLIGRDKTCIAQVWESALHNKLKDLRKPDRNEIASILINKIGCKRGNSGIFPKYGKQKEYMVPQRLRK